MHKPVQIAIVGGSGSGKTWLAERLCATLGRAAARLSLDDFYRDLSPMPAADRARVNFDDPAAIDWELVSETLAALARGEPAGIPSYDFAAHTRRRQWHRLTPGDFVIWDGLWLLHEDWLRRRFALSVFVDCPPEARLERRIDRDVRERQRTPESVRRQFQEHVEPMHGRHVAPQRRWATCCVSSPTDEQSLHQVASLARGLAAAPGSAAAAAPLNFNP